MNNAKDPWQDLEKNMKIIKERLNRRQGERLSAEVPFTYKVKGKSSIYEGVSLNISSYGLAFYSTVTIFENDKLLFNFNLNKEDIVIEASITRISGKEVSCEFQMDEAQRSRFIHLFNKEIADKNTDIKITFNSIYKRLD